MTIIDIEAVRTGASEARRMRRDLEIAAADAAAKLDETRRELAQAVRVEREANELARTHNSDKARWKRATAAIRAQGVRFRSNVQKCCRGCVVNEDVGLPADAPDDTPLAWTYGGQGGRIVWDEYTGAATRSRDRGPVKAYVNHQGEGVAQIVTDAFRAEGFTVNWDGTMADTVTVEFTGGSR